MLPLCKFYRYLIYRLYHFRDDTPIINTIITLGVVHWSILLSFRIVIEQFVHIDPIIGSSKESNIIFAIFWFALHYILIQLLSKSTLKDYIDLFYDIEKIWQCHEVLDFTSVKKIK